MELCFLYEDYFKRTVQGQALPITTPQTKQHDIHDSIQFTCQMHTDYTVSTHDILIFEKCSVVFVICMDNNQQLDVFV